MSRRIVVTGTDTDVGKTVFAAGLADFLQANYWKPVQAGLDGETDTELVMRLGGLTPERIGPERYRLTIPASPHYAAARDGTHIDMAALDPPDTQGPLVIEGAGGLMVPLTRTTLNIDLFARWGCPAVLCARTALGTINHSLLSIEALRKRGIGIIGIAFIGDENSDSESIICEMGRVKHLGRLPWLAPLSHETLRAAFSSSFHASDFS